MKTIIGFSIVLLLAGNLFSQWSLTEVPVCTNPAEQQYSVSELSYVNGQPDGISMVWYERKW